MPDENGVDLNLFIEFAACAGAYVDRTGCLNPVPQAIAFEGTKASMISLLEKATPLELADFSLALLVFIGADKKLWG